MNNLIFRIFLLAFLIGSFSACVPTKRLTYLQENPESAKKYKLQRSAYKVQPNDILSITIRSYDLETAQLFNISSQQSANALNAGDILFYLQGYSIDLNGDITIPIIGDLNVVDKSIEEIQLMVEKELSKYFTEEAINVTVQLAGIRFSIVGEVARPGKYVVYQNQVNIFEALATAGDITIVGDRREVMVVRQLPEGIETFQLDLTDAEVINNPHYFIQPNDVINIKPLPQKALGIGTEGFQTIAQILSVAASTITLIIAINSLN